MVSPGSYSSADLTALKDISVPFKKEEPRVRVRDEMPEFDMLESQNSIFTETENISHSQID